MAEPKITIDLAPQEADLLMDAINMAIKAAPNSIEFSLMINPVAVRLGQARAALANGGAPGQPEPANRQQRRAAERKSNAE